MRLTTIVLAASLPLLVSALAACGDEDASVATDRATGAPAAASHGPVPEQVPAAQRVVRTAHLAMVTDSPDGGAQLCLGPATRSLPPQCDGLPLAGWDWDDNPMHETRGDQRWGSFAVTGRWDGETLEVTDAVPAALYDVAVDASPVAPTPTEDLDERELSGVAEEASMLPGHLASYVVDGQVVVDVVHDDGSLQQWADERWGPGVVVLVSQLTTGDPS